MASIIIDILLPQRLHRFAYLLRLLIFAICLELILAFHCPAETSTATSIIVISLKGVSILLISLYAMLFVLLPRIRDSGMSERWLVASVVPVVNIFLGIIFLFKKPEVRFVRDTCFYSGGLTNFVDDIIARHACGQSEMCSQVIDLSAASRLRLIACHFCGRMWDHYPLDWASEVFRRDKAIPRGYVSDIDWENSIPRDAIKVAEDYCVGQAACADLEKAQQKVREFATEMQGRYLYAFARLGDTAAPAEYEVGRVTHYAAAACAAASAATVDLEQCSENAALAIGFRWQQSEYAAAVKEEEVLQEEIRHNWMSASYLPKRKHPPQTAVDLTPAGPDEQNAILENIRNTGEYEPLGALIDLLVRVSKRLSGSSIAVDIIGATGPEEYFSRLTELESTLTQSLSNNAGSFPTEDLVKCSELSDFSYTMVYGDPAGEYECIRNFSEIRKLAQNEIANRASATFRY